MRKPLLLFALCGAALFAVARDNLRLPDTRALGMQAPGSSHSVLFNPSLVAFLPAKEARFDYFNRYSLKELGTLSLGLNLPNQLLPVALQVASFGYDAYRESLFRLAVGKQLNSCLAIGVAFQYIMLESELYETNPSLLATDLGVVYRMVDNGLITLSIINMPSIQISKDELQSHSLSGYLIELGVNKPVINNVLITGGLGYGNRQALFGSLGMEYVALTDFSFRCGIRTTPFLPSLGVGYQLAACRVDAALVYHPLLGISPGIGFSYTFD